MRSRWLGVGVAGVLFLTVACGGGNGGDEAEDVAAQSTTPPAATGGVPQYESGADKVACDLATPEEVTSATGRAAAEAVKGGVDESKSDGGYQIGSSCNYKDADGATVATVDVHDRDREYAGFKAGLGREAKEVTGLGEEAFCLLEGYEDNPFAGLWVAKGDGALQIWVDGAGHCDGSIRQLAEIVVPKFS